MAAALDQQGILQIVALVVELLKHIADSGGIAGQDALKAKLDAAHTQLQSHLAEGGAVALPGAAPALNLSPLMDKFDALAQSFRDFAAQQKGA